MADLLTKADRARVRQLAAENRYQHEELAHLAADAVGTIDALVGMLRVLDWGVRVQTEDYDGDACPDCDRSREDGHHGTCLLAALLAAVEGER